jgi:hypothetical protein
MTLDEMIEKECKQLKKETESYYDAATYMEDIVNDVKEAFPNEDKELVEDKIEEYMRTLFGIVH